MFHLRSHTQSAYATQWPAIFFLLLQVAEEVVRREAQIRPIDCLKIFNCLALLVLLLYYCQYSLVYEK